MDELGWKVQEGITHRSATWALLHVASLHVSSLGFLISWWPRGRSTFLYGVRLQRGSIPRGNNVGLQLPACLAWEVSCTNSTVYYQSKAVTGLAQIQGEGKKTHLLAERMANNKLSL